MGITIDEINDDGSRQKNGKGKQGGVSMGNVSMINGRVIVDGKDITDIVHNIIR